MTIKQQQKKTNCNLKDLKQRTPKNKKQLLLNYGLCATRVVHTA